MITIFKNLFDKQPYHISVADALERIRKGTSKKQVEEIRAQLDKERASNLKKNLPVVKFSGRFSDRTDNSLIEHSGFIVLDFDDLPDLRGKQEELINYPFVHACWVSPSGNGLKALVAIADKSKHREHFNALMDEIKGIDRSGVNEARACFESYDPSIYINQEFEPFKSLKNTERIEVRETVNDQSEIFKRLLKWITNRGDAFVTGERNTFVFKLASACCRFGIDESDALRLIEGEIQTSNTFSANECRNAVKSAYRTNKARFGSAIFENEKLIEKTTRSEVELPAEIFDPTIRPKDVIFGEDVKEQALYILEHGYERLAGVGITELDEKFKFKRGEITLLTGIGNYGKSTFWHWFILMRVINYDERWAFFSPESNPAHEFYHDFVEMMLGAECTPYGAKPVGRTEYEAAYDWVSKRIFYVFPKEIAPTPAYIKERFLELIIKEKISGVVIDPFNQLSNDYNSAGGRSDKYLETFLSDCTRFAQINDIFFTIIAHPKLMRKDADGNYPCPDVFDIADGAMWNNKMDNILVYHRPNHQKEPGSPLCELHTKKIRRQKSVGKKGVIEFELYRTARRFYFNGTDAMQHALEAKGLDFKPRQGNVFSQMKAVEGGDVPF